MGAAQLEAPTEHIKTSHCPAPTTKLRSQARFSKIGVSPKDCCWYLNGKGRCVRLSMGSWLMIRVRPTLSLSLADTVVASILTARLCKPVHIRLILFVSSSLMTSWCRPNLCLGPSRRKLRPQLAVCSSPYCCSTAAGSGTRLQITAYLLRSGKSHVSLDIIFTHET
jgi:hypothetical protein